jgi:hypothetical protein
MGDSFGGFTMIKAERLEYKTITQALLNGDFYASEGPEIRSIYAEDGVVHIETAPADKVTMSTGIRRADVIYDEGTPVTSWEVPIRENDVYIRFTVYDKFGKRAWSRAYFIDEILD